MLETTTKEINGYRITYFPLPARAAAKLDLKVVRSLSPILKGLSKFTGSQDDTLASVMDMDVSALGDIASSVLSSIDDAFMDDLMLSSLRGCTVCAPGAAPVQVDTLEDIDKCFHDIDALYKAVYESWRYNRLSPFVLWQRIGQKTQRTGTSGTQEGETPRAGLKLER